MNVTNAKYLKDVLSGSDENIGIQCEIDGIVCSVPMNPANTDYAEIMQQVEAGTLTIAPADEE